MSFKYRQKPTELQQSIPRKDLVFTLPSVHATLIPKQNSRNSTSVRPTVISNVNMHTTKLGVSQWVFLTYNYFGHHLSCRVLQSTTLCKVALLPSSDDRIL